MIQIAHQMALQCPLVYHLMQKVISLFEEGKLKGQEPPKLTGAIVWKALEGKLLTYFKVFQGLKVGKLTLCIKINNMLCTYTLLYIMQPKSLGRPWEQGYFGLLSNPKLDSGMAWE